jgi:hypothetical protein
MDCDRALRLRSVIAWDCDATLPAQNGFASECDVTLPWSERLCIALRCHSAEGRAALHRIAMLFCRAQSTFAWLAERLWAPGAPWQGVRMPFCRARSAFARCAMPTRVLQRVIGGSGHVILAPRARIARRDAVPLRR